MKKHIYAAGTFALALSISVVPMVARAEGARGEGKGDSRMEAETQALEIVEVRSHALESDDEVSSEGRQNQELKGREDRDEEVDSDEQELELELEDDEDIASSFDELMQKIELRKHELEDEEASTTLKLRDVVKNANPVRLAVHSLLASKELLGGIGPQVSEIAKRMNDSVATTTNAEAQIESRSFLAKIFFGGDKRAAEAINRTVERNEESIAELAELLNQANLSVDIKAVLEAQITALKEAQTRFQALAEREQRTWGLFSWRF